MAERRMFSRRIVSSARFLRMPAICQALYFQLGINADDDGVVEAFAIVRAVGATEGDLMTLEERGFVKILNEDLITYIVDWTEQNKIRPDRKNDSIYKDLLDELGVETLEKRPRKKPEVTDLAGVASEDPEVEKEADADIGQSMDGPMTGQCTHSVSVSVSGIDINNNKHSLTASGERASKKPGKAELEKEFAELWLLYPKKRGKEEAVKAYVKARKEGIAKDEIRKGLEAFCASTRGTDLQYIPYGSTWFHQRRWADDYQEAKEIQSHDWDYKKLEEAAQNALYNAV